MSECVEILATLKRARAIVFDFDGTLVDSTSIKRRAFEVCFAEFTQRRDEILAYCWNHPHTVRGDKFRYVYEQILKRPYTPRIAAELHERFEAATTRQIIEAPEIPGATAFLKEAARRHLTALLSSTPQATLREILDGRGWREWFAVVQGAPVRKAEWLRTFRASHDFSESDAVFFGDTQEDADAAKAVGCPFIHLGGDQALGEHHVPLANFLSLVTDGSHSG